MVVAVGGFLPLLHQLLLLLLRLPLLLSDYSINTAAAAEASISMRQSSDSTHYLALIHISRCQRSVIVS